MLDFDGLLETQQLSHERQAFLDRFENWQQVSP